MVPRRRTVLGLLGGGLAGLAGCAALSESEADPTETPTATRTETPTETETATPQEPSDLTVDETWATFQADAARTGYAPEHTGPGATPDVNWRTDTWGLLTSPVVADGTVYVATGLRHQHVHAFDAATGQERWRREVDGRRENVLAVADGIVFVGLERLSAFDAETGETLWEDGRDVRNGVAIADGRVIAPSDATDRIRAFDARTGDTLWEQRLSSGLRGGSLSATATPAIGGEQVLVASHEDVFALDAATGEERWQQAVGDRVRTAPTVTDEHVYVGVQGRLRALEAANGSEAWQYTGDLSRASPAVADGTLYVGGRFAGDEDGDGDGDEGGAAEVAGLVALDAATGEERWRVAREGFAAHSPVVADDLVYVASEDNRLYALDAATGEVRWSLAFEWDLGTPALLEDALAVSAGGRLYSIGAGANADRDPWAGVVTPTDEAGAGPSPEYTDHEFYFGTNGYDVAASAEGSSTGDDAPFSFAVDVTGERITADEEVTIEFALTNEGEDAITIENGAPAPFGVLTLRGSAGTDRALTAWSDAYEESGHVHWTPHRGVTGVNSIAVSETVAPGETVREEYTLSGATHGLQPGTYSFHDDYRVYGGAGRPDDDEVWHAGAYVRVEIEQPSPEAGDVRLDVAVTEEAAVPEAFIGDLSVDVLEPVTDTHPGLVEITLENDADNLGSVSSPGRLPFAAHLGLAADGSRLVLLDEDMFAPSYVVDAGDEGAWIPTFQPHVERVRGRRSSRFEADAHLSKRYLVLGDPEAEDPLTPGEYVFDQGYADDDVEFPWGFRLALRARDS